MSRPQLTPYLTCRCHMRKAALRLVCEALLFVVIATGVGRIIIADGNALLPCTALDETLWSRSADTEGIFVIDARRDIGGAVDVVKFDPDTPFGRIGNALVGGYYPVSGGKELACGTLQGWEVYRLGTLERD